MHRRFRRITIQFSDRGFDATSIHGRKVCVSDIHIHKASSLQSIRRCEASGAKLGFGVSDFPSTRSSGAPFHGHMQHLFLEVSMHDNDKVK